MRILLLLGVLQTICGIGLLITPIYFQDETCELFTGGDAVKRAESTLFECSPLSERVIFYFSEIDRALFTSAFFGPMVSGITEIIYALKRSKVISYSRIYVIMGLVFCYVIITWTLVVELMVDRYYIESRCPPTYDQSGEFCTFVGKNFGLMQSEIGMAALFTYLGLLSTALFLKRTYERIGLVKL
ncbi:MAG: hypothetical protein ACRD38_06855 [Nitrososphaerales archaeon]